MSTFRPSDVLERTRFHCSADCLASLFGRWQHGAWWRMGGGGGTARALGSRIGGGGGGGCECSAAGGLRTGARARVRFAGDSDASGGRGENTHTSRTWVAESEHACDGGTRMVTRKASCMTMKTRRRRMMRRGSSRGVRVGRTPGGLLNAETSLPHRRFCA